MDMHHENLGSLVSSETTRKGTGPTAAKTVAKIIDFYIPSSYQRRVRWIPQEQRGKVIEFCLPQKKTA